MISITRFGILITAFQTLIACGGTGVNELLFLEGERTAEYNRNTVIDSWQKSGDSLIGKRYYAGLLAGDTALQDVFKIYNNGKLTLEWSNPKGINPYYLYLDAKTDSAFTFKNEKYAYPKEVVIGRAGNDSVFFKSYGEHGVVPKGVKYVFGSE